MSTNKKFDGYLICSDWDGTLSHNVNVSATNINGTATTANKAVVSPENCEAIKYFQENGGLFTICSGRQYTYLRDYYNYVKPNTAIVSLCGALIYDDIRDEKVYEGYVNEPKMPIIDKIIERPELISIVYAYIGGSLKADVFTAAEYMAHREKIESSDLYKIVFITENEENMAQLVEYANKLDLNGNLLVRSWPLGLEIYSSRNSKGNAVRLLKEKTGVHTLICVGDYENDIDMIEAADIGYAVGNAVDSVKRVADRITVDYREHAIAKIIYDLDAEISAKQ